MQSSFRRPVLAALAVLAVGCTAEQTAADPVMDMLGRFGGRVTDMLNPLKFGESRDLDSVAGCLQDFNTIVTGLGALSASRMYNALHDEGIAPYAQAEPKVRWTDDDLQKVVDYGIGNRVACMGLLSLATPKELDSLQAIRQHRQEVELRDQWMMQAASDFSAAMAAYKPAASRAGSYFCQISGEFGENIEAVAARTGNNVQKAKAQEFARARQRLCPSE